MFIFSCLLLLTMTPSEVIRRIKGRNSTKSFAAFSPLHKRLCGRHFWARGCFCASSGNVTDEIIKKYFEPPLEPKKDDEFRTES